MRRVLWPVLFILLASACTLADRNEGAKLTTKEVKEKKKELDYLEAQKSIKTAKIDGVSHEMDETRRELDKIRGERDDISKELETRLEKMEEMVAQARKLARQLRPPTPEEETAAEKLLLEARFFQRDNPTEAKSIIAAKYKKVFESYPRTKAAQEAKKIYSSF